MGNLLARCYNLSQTDLRFSYPTSAGSPGEILVLNGEFGFGVIVNRSRQEGKRVDDEVV